MKRIIFDLFFFTAVFLGPWWLASAIGILFVIIFKQYWELLIAGIILDALYYIPSNDLWGNFGIFSLVSFLAITIAEKTKKQIRI